MIAGAADSQSHSNVARTQVYEVLYVVPDTIIFGCEKEY
jgi:hypothetical protein